jgi:PAS domain S-box-containing protein
MHCRGIFSYWSIRKKLSLLLLIFFLPAFWIIIASSLGEREHELETARDNALLIVQSLAAQQEKIVTGTKQMLSTLAQLPEVQRLDAASCNKLFTQLNQQYSFYSTLIAATPDGNMFAASTPFAPNSINLSDRKHIKDAIHTLDFSAGEYIVGRLSKVRSLNYSYPVLGAERKLIAILVAGFKLDEFALFIKNANLPEGSVAVITDHKGVRLFRMPESDRAAVGTPISEKLASELDHGIFERTSGDGVYRIYAFKQLRLGEDSRPYLSMLVGLPKDKILAKANLKMLRNLAMLGFAALAAIALVWGLANFVFLKPIGRLVEATRRFGGGELEARILLPHTSDELGQLAQSLDDMASLLERKDHERKEAKEALQHAYDGLEQRVRERTHQLATANQRLGREIEEREHAERVLRQSEERYRLVFANVPLGIMHFDSTSRITGCNDKFAAIIGAAKEKIVGFNLVLQLRDEQFRQAVAAALEGKTGSFEGDYLSVCGGKPSQLRALFQRIDSEEGGFLGGVGIFEDITERKLAETERERLIKELQEALSKVKLLGGLLPICANCKKIRDDKGYWQQIEAYIRKHSEAEFSHGICPECARKLYPQFIKE